MAARRRPTEPGFRAFRHGEVDKRVPEAGTGCLLWGGAVNDQGYGYVTVGKRPNKRSIRQHRYFYQLAKAVILGPDDHLNHTCHTRRCGNPDHLEVVTVTDHIAYHKARGKKPSAAQLRRERERAEAAIAAQQAAVPF